MLDLFSDLPEAIENISDLLDKIDVFTLDRDVLLPKFNIPNKFLDPTDELNDTKKGENAYLRYLTYNGAQERYKEITDEIKERIDFELQVIALGAIQIRYKGGAKYA